MTDENEIAGPVRRRRNAPIRDDARGTSGSPGPHYDEDELELADELRLDELELALLRLDDPPDPPADLRIYLSGVLAGALARDPTLDVEPHELGDRRLPSLEIRQRWTGERVVVHFDPGL